MSEAQWSAVDSYINDQLVKPDPVYAEIIERSRASGLPAISVTPAQGRLLELLARAINARDVLEIGTLGGYSATWLAHGVGPGGRVITIELDPKHAEVARANLELAEVSDRVEIIIAPAAEVLARFAKEGRRFDLVFIDADSPHYAEYFQDAMRISHPGTVIIVDNVVRNGGVADEQSNDPMVLGARRFNEAAAAEPRAAATAIQTVGTKGYDGFALIVVTASQAIKPRG